jgi:hypothetical protein
LKKGIDGGLDKRRETKKKGKKGGKTRAPPENFSSINSEGKFFFAGSCSVFFVEGI